jgi:hypothetical protein
MMGNKKSIFNANEDSRYGKLDLRLQITVEYTVQFKLEFMFLSLPYLSYI